jgi:RNA polymerase sigma-70 factor (ECF subfamily)
VSGQAGADAVQDSLLVQAAREGQAWAEEAIWVRYAPLVHRVARGTLGTAHEAEDAAQDSFVTLFSRLDGLAKPEALRSFVYSIAVRTIRWHLRRRRIRRWISLSDAVDSVEPLAKPTDHEARDLLRRFYRILDALGTDDRMVFVLRHVEDMKLEEVAATMSLSLATVKRRLARSQQAIDSAIRETPDLASSLAQLGRMS